MVGHKAVRKDRKRWWSGPARADQAPARADQAPAQDGGDDAAPTIIQTWLDLARRSETTKQFLGLVTPPKRRIAMALPLLAMIGVGYLVVAVAPEPIANEQAAGAPAGADGPGSSRSPMEAHQIEPRAVLAESANPPKTRAANRPVMKPADKMKKKPSVRSRSSRTAARIRRDAAVEVEFF
jgi:hypothetical protein